MTDEEINQTQDETKTEEAPKKVLGKRFREDEHYQVDIEVTTPGKKKQKLDKGLEKIVQNEINKIKNQINLSVNAN